jgi:hypothetical protein
MSRAGVIAAIDTALSSVSSPTFSSVYVGEPLSIAGTPTAAFWLTSHNDLFDTLGDVSTTAVFTIRCYWRMQTSQDVRETIEDELWDAIVGIKTALRADSALGGNATDSRPGDATAGYIELSGLAFRQVTMSFEVDIYGDYAIAP